jgi:hypothetical protein
MSQRKSSGPLLCRIANETIQRALTLQKVLLIEIGSSKPASDQLWAERALLLTHQHPTPEELSLAFTFWYERSAAKGDAASRWLVGTTEGAKPAARKLVLNWWDSIGGYRRGLRARVLEIIDDPTKALVALELDMDAGALTDILAVPRMWWDGEEVRTDLFYFCPTMESAFTLALVKLFASKSIKAALRICALKQCERIFISQPPPGGGPRPSYCTSEHRELAARLTGAERTARWRKNQARKPK